jgi:hypothetical protein
MTTKANVAAIYCTAVPILTPALNAWDQKMPPYLPSEIRWRAQLAEKAKKASLQL